MKSFERLRGVFLATVVCASFGLVPPAGASQNAQFPPQLPTPAEMAQLQAQLEVTLAKVRTAQKELDAIVRKYESAEHRLGEIHEQITQTDNQQKALEAELRAAKASINKRAASIYRSEGVGLINVVLSAKTYRQFLMAYRLVQSVAKRDSENLGRVSSLKAETERLRNEQEAQRQAEQAALAELGKQQKQVKSALQAVGREYDLVRSELEKRKSGFAFPVKAPYSYTDSWGAPRMEGTSYYHRHEGTDIFALAGTPVVSVVDGVIEKLGTASLGGIKLWVRSPGDRWSYYYAHLSGYAAGITNGTHVKKGQILGFVGNTGNARGTPPHLHFETHVPNGAAVNPYPILRKADPIAK